jgi:hypothetical protein
MPDWTINTKLANKLRGALPPSLFFFLRNWGAALVTPVLFSKRTGHFKSSLRARSLDARSNPIPWYTYPAVDFLAGKDYSGRKVLEFGAGHSTLWWMKRAAEVMAIEGSEQWFNHLRTQVATNVVLHLMKSPAEDLRPVINNRKFDIIVIDGVDGTGCNRAQSAQIITELDLLTPGGGVIFDDSEGSFDEPGNDWQKSGQNINFFREKGFSRVDFFGYAPGQLQWRCTSIFFKGNCFLFEGKEVPRKSGA